MMEMTLNEEIEYLQSGNWYDKVQAVLPTDEYLKLGWAIGDILETLELFRGLAPELQTNADRIRAMSDEELAVFLSAVKFRRETPLNVPDFLYIKDAHDWLQQIYEGE